MSYTLRGQQKLVVVGNKICEILFSPKGINKWGKLGKLTKNDTLFLPFTWSYYETEMNHHHTACRVSGLVTCSGPINSLEVF
jgi:hypothetical protein